LKNNSIKQYCTKISKNINYKKNLRDKGNEMHI